RRRNGRTQRHEENDGFATTGLDQMALSFHSTTISLCVPMRQRQLRAPGFAVRGVDASPGASWVSAMTQTGRSPVDELLLFESLALSGHTSCRVQIRTRRRCRGPCVLSSLTARSRSKKAECVLGSTPRLRPRTSRALSLHRPVGCSLEQLPQLM